MEYKKVQKTLGKKVANNGNGSDQTTNKNSLMAFFVNFEIRLLFEAL